MYIRQFAHLDKIKKPEKNDIGERCYTCGPCGISVATYENRKHIKTIAHLRNCWRSQGSRTEPRPAISPFTSVEGLYYDGLSLDNRPAMLGPCIGIQRAGSSKSPFIIEVFTLMALD